MILDKREMIQATLILILVGIGCFIVGMLVVKSNPAPDTLFVYEKISAKMKFVKNEETGLCFGYIIHKGSVSMTAVPCEQVADKLIKVDIENAQRD